MRNKKFLVLSVFFVFIILITGVNSIPLIDFDRTDTTTILTKSSNLTNFTELLDTPSSYTGSDDLCLIVNETANKIEFRSCASGTGDITAVTTDLTDFLLGGDTTGAVDLNFNGTLLNLTIAKEGRLIGFNSTFNASYITSTEGNDTYIKIGDGIQNNTGGWTLNFSNIYSLDWTNVTITESQITDLSHTVDTNESVRFEDLIGFDCPAGQLVIGVQANGTVLCATDSGGLSSSEANSTYLKLTGGNLTGNLNMSRNNITDINIAKLTRIFFDDGWILRDQDVQGISRLLLESGGANAAAELLLAPKGSSRESRLSVSNNPSTSNFNALTLQSNETDVFINSEVDGTATKIPLHIEMDGTEVITISTDNNVGILNNNPTDALNVTGNIGATGVICDSNGCIGSGSGGGGLFESIGNSIVNITAVELNVSKINSADWTNVTITESQITDLSHIGNNEITLTEANITDLSHTGSDEITLNILNITGIDDNACTGTNKVSNVTFDNGNLKIVCSADEDSGTSNPFDQVLNTTSNVQFSNITIINGGNLTFTANQDVSPYNISAGFFKGLIDCTNITGGSDGDFCTDADSGGGGATAWQFTSTTIFNDTGSSVGIGTSSPQTDLNIFGTGGGLNISNSTDTHLIIDDTSGSVGIGTSNPGNPLVVSSSGSIGGDSTGLANAYLEVTDGTSSLGFDPNEISSNNSIRLAISSASDIRFNPGDTFAVDIKSDGKVGIGTSSPRSVLSVETSNGGQVNFDPFGGGSVFINGSGALGYIGALHNFYETIGSDEILVASVNEGKFGVNDSSPDFQLEVSGVSGSGYFGVTDSTDGDIFAINSNGNLEIGENITFSADTSPSLIEKIATASSPGSLFHIKGQDGGDGNDGGGDLKLESGDGQGLGVNGDIVLDTGINSLGGVGAIINLSGFVKAEGGIEDDTFGYIRMVEDTASNSTDKRIGSDSTANTVFTGGAVSWDDSDNFFTATYGGKYLVQIKARVSCDTTGQFDVDLYVAGTLTDSQRATCHTVIDPYMQTHDFVVDVDAGEDIYALIGPITAINHGLNNGTTMTVERRLA